MKVDDNTDLPSGVSIGQKIVDEFIAYTGDENDGNKNHSGALCSQKWF